MTGTNGSAAAPHGHNHHGPNDHLHSHPHAAPHAPEPARPKDDDALLADALMDGFVAADDKASFLRVARVPLALPGEGGETLRLVDVELTYAYQVGTASPAFNADELIYLPFPAAMIKERAGMTFVYVSLQQRRDVTLNEMVALLNARPSSESDRK